jgi:hypothetical protein
MNYASLNWVWWFTTIISVLRGWRQENYEFEASLAKGTRPHLKIN